MAGNVLVTGSMGCIGAWVLHHLVASGRHAVSFDLSDDRHRLDLLLTREQQEAITFVQGDITDAAAVSSAIEDNDVEHIVHLAALQVPFCKANPTLGARVNVVGTVNVFEAARAIGIRHVALASSIAVYGPASSYQEDMLGADAALDPRTLYGVYKQANEGTARIYFADHGITSTVLRPYTVYGVGRDQGMTSEPTKAMLAVASGRAYTINFGGWMQFHLASDVARLFLEAAETPSEGARAYNLGAAPALVQDVADLLNELAAEELVNVVGDALPFPRGVSDGGLYDVLGDPGLTPLADGVRATVEQFREALAAGTLQP